MVDRVVLPFGRIFVSVLGLGQCVTAIRAHAVFKTMLGRFRNYLVPAVGRPPVARPVVLPNVVLKAVLVHRRGQFVTAGYALSVFIFVRPNVRNQILATHRGTVMVAAVEFKNFGKNVPVHLFRIRRGDCNRRAAGCGQRRCGRGYYFLIFFFSFNF